MGVILFSWVDACLHNLGDVVAARCTHNWEQFSHSKHSCYFPPIFGSMVANFISHQWHCRITKHIEKQSYKVRKILLSALFHSGQADIAAKPYGVSRPASQNRLHLIYRDDNKENIKALNYWVPITQCRKIMGNKNIFRGSIGIRT